MVKKEFSTFLFQIDGKLGSNAVFLSFSEVYNKIFSFTQLSEESAGITIELDRIDNIGWVNGSILFQTLYQGFPSLFKTIILPITLTISIVIIVTIAVIIWLKIKLAKQEIST